jgi:hypothetical protein
MIKTAEIDRGRKAACVTRRPVQTPSQARANRNYRRKVRRVTAPHTLSFIPFHELPNLYAVAPRLRVLNPKWRGNIKWKIQPSQTASIAPS